MILRILCPICPQNTKTTLRGVSITCGSDLTIIQENYSGCGVDIGECPDCGKVFHIAYKKEIESITEV